MNHFIRLIIKSLSTPVLVSVFELTSVQTRSPLQLHVLLLVFHHLLPLPHLFGPVGAIVRQANVHLLRACNRTRLIQTVKFQKVDNNDEVLGRQVSHRQRSTHPFFLTVLRILFFHIASVGLPPGRLVLCFFSLSEVTSVTAVLLYRFQVSHINVLIGHWTQRTYPSAQEGCRGGNSS